MAYIAPNSTITICKGVPLDNSYGDTIYFSSVSDQSSYFADKAVYSFTSQSYQRVGKGKIRVEQCADDLYGCNYLYFVNTSFGSKRFYAFITGVEYINNITSEITYELDVMQTWHFSYEVGYCFVEREHVTDDTIGANVIQEPINFGDIRARTTQASEHGDSYRVVIATGYDSDDNTPGGVYGRIPSGLNYIFANADSKSALNTLWEYLQATVDAEKDDAIVSIWMQLTDFTSTDDDISDATQVAVIRMPSNIDGYTPKNNKLFTYPYNYICIDSGNDSAEYRFEWFNKYADEQGGAPFVMVGATCPNPEVICAPMGYNTNPYTSSSNANTINYTEGVVMKDFPQLAWATDAYRAWVANGGYYSTLFSVGASAAGVATGVMSANPALAASGAIGMGSAINTAVHQANKGATGHGAQGGSALVNCRAKDFWFKHMQIQYDYAKMIDDYFTMYGYQVNKVKQPSRNGRPRWNYVKTQNCIILSESVPSDDVSKIESIYDNGITFWMSGSYVGRYTGDNSPS